MKNLILLPGIIAPAAIRYEKLMSRLSGCVVIAKDLEVYAGETPPCFRAKPTSSPSK